MSVIDANGRVFGRVNLVDAAVLVFVLLLIPVGYATFLLFRPSQPAIEGVARVDPTVEDHRVAGDQLLIKLKVKGSGFNPLLRARIGDTSALAFVFENPNSADVLVGRVPPGRHDLVLYDGVQEVARSRDAVEIIQRTEKTAAWVRLTGWLTSLETAQAKQFDAGFASDHESNAFRIVAVGPIQPAHDRIASGGAIADLPVPDRVERAAEVIVRCDAERRSTCLVGGNGLRQEPPFPVTLAGGIAFHVEEVGPPADPRPATVWLQFNGPLPRVQRGDRDLIVAPRAAQVLNVAGASVMLRLGADESREGWRYRGQLLTPGALFHFRTGRYVASGRVASVSVAEPAAKP